MVTAAIPLTTAEAWMPWERRVRELLYRLYAIDRRRSAKAATGPLALMQTRTAEPAYVESTMVVLPLQLLAAARSGTDYVLFEGSKAAAAQRPPVSTFAAWLVCVDEVKASQTSGSRWTPATTPVRMEKASQA